MILEKTPSSPPFRLSACAWRNCRHLTSFRTAGERRLGRLWRCLDPLNSHPKRFRFLPVQSSACFSSAVSLSQSPNQNQTKTKLSQPLGQPPKTPVSRHACIPHSRSRSSSSTRHQITIYLPHDSKDTKAENERRPPPTPAEPRPPSLASHVLCQLRLWQCRAQLCQPGRRAAAWNAAGAAVYGQSPAAVRRHGSPRRLSRRESAHDGRRQRRHDAGPGHARHGPE